MNKELLQFKPLRDVPYNEMERLLKVSSIKNNKLIWLHFIKSFKQLNPKQEIALHSFMLKGDEESYNSLKSNYGDIILTRFPINNVQPINDWLQNIEALEKLYLTGKAANIKDIVESKELSILKNHSRKSGSSYLFKRKLFLQKYNYSSQHINGIEELLKLQGFKKVGSLLSEVLTLIEEKKLTTYFLDQLYERLYLLQFDEDLIHHVNREFSENLQRLNVEQ